MAGGVSLYLVRHAKAGNRATWEDPDPLRPLTKSGSRQARGLVEVLDDEKIDCLLSSSHVRCVQTIEPLAAERGLEIEHCGALEEGTPLGATLELIEEVSDRPAVLCTHGDVVENLVGYLQSSGVVEADVRKCKKGSTWVLSLDGNQVVCAKYLSPPD